jgi:hypothetical protein
VSARASVVAAALLAAAALPLAWHAATGLGAGALLSRVATGLLFAIDAVGWVLVPQLVLGVAILSLALQQILSRAAGLAPPPAPAWLDPAVESVLLLGLLGTVSGMVSGFVGISPEEIEPGPLVHGLGVALRSTFVGFALALVGVWTRARPA